MNFKFVRKGIVITAFACATLIPAQQIIATEKPIIAGLTQAEKNGEIDSVGLVNAIAEIQKQENTEKTLKIESTEEMKFQSMLTGKTFVTVTEGTALVMEAADENSACIGKVYRNSVVKITERGDSFSKIESGNVIGYVKTENLITGKDAVAHAKVILTEGLYVLNEEVRDIMDVKVYVFTPLEVIKERWYKRAVSRGKTGEAADLQFKNVNETAQQYIRPTYQIADCIINGMVDKEYIKVITDKIMNKLAEICNS